MDKKLSSPVLKKILAVCTHAVLWLALLSLPYFFKPDLPGHPRGTLLDDILLPPRIANGLLLILVFYLNYFLVIPRLYLRKRFVLFGASIVFNIGLFVLLNYSMMPLYNDLLPMGLGILGPSHNIFLFIITYILSFTTSVYNQWQSAIQEKMKTEISFLKSQINPHFLFNTLNTIYSLTITQSDEAPDAVIKLSGMMRYAISESDRDVVSLKKELDYIENYIALQSMRIPAKVKLQHDIVGSGDSLFIAPFVLIPFIENAFKHGINAEEDSDIRINIQIDNRELHMTVVNNKVYVQHNDDIKTGLGINKTVGRLKILYPGRHDLKIHDADDTFTVSLKLNLA